MRKLYTPATAASDVENVLKMLEGRWKLIILFHLFDGKVQRYSDLGKLIPDISQKMLAQQLRQLERMASWRAKSIPRCRRKWSPA